MDNIHLDPPKFHHNPNRGAPVDTSDHILNLSQNHQSVHSSLEVDSPQNQDAQTDIAETTLLLPPPQKVRHRPASVPPGGHKVPSESGSLLSVPNGRAKSYGALDSVDGGGEGENRIVPHEEMQDSRSAVGWVLPMFNW